MQRRSALSRTPRGNALYCVLVQAASERGIELNREGLAALRDLIPAESREAFAARCSCDAQLSELEVAFLEYVVNVGVES